MVQMELKKYEFDHIGMSRLIATSGVSGPPEFHCKEKKPTICNGKFIEKYHFWNQTSQEEIKPAVMQKHESQKQIRLFLQLNLEFLVRLLSKINHI